jgi:transcriptional repressor NrdR
VPEGSAEKAVDEIEARLRSLGSSEVASATIGELAMEKLRALDHIAFIRFASVYQSYEDIETLKREVDQLLDERAP